MRTIFYGIPVLILGVLAALPFRRASGPRPVEPVETPSFHSDLIVSVPLVRPPRADPPSSQQVKEMDKPVVDLSPLTAEDYASIAVPVRVPRVIAERFSATIPDETLSHGPLVGHRSSFQSQNQQTRSTLLVDGSKKSWQKGLVVGDPETKTSLSDSRLVKTNKSGPAVSIESSVLSRSTVWAAHNEGDSPPKGRLRSSFKRSPSVAEVTVGPELLKTPQPVQVRETLAAVDSNPSVTTEPKKVETQKPSRRKRYFIREPIAPTDQRS